MWAWTEPFKVDSSLKKTKLYLVPVRRQKFVDINMLIFASENANVRDERRQQQLFFLKQVSSFALSGSDTLTSLHSSII